MTGPQINYYIDLALGRRHFSAGRKKSIADPTPTKLQMLTAEETLRAQAHLSVAERVADFNAKHAPQKLTAGRLKSIYKRSKVRYKKVITKTRSRRTETAATIARD